MMVGSYRPARRERAGPAELIYSSPQVHAARIARLEELLVRVRANAALGPSLRTRAFIEPEPVVDPTIDEEIEEIDRAALKQSLERHIEVALGDPGPTVPFPEELEGWEPDPLELERDDGPRLLNRRDADIDLVDVAIPSAPRAPSRSRPRRSPSPASSAACWRRPRVRAARSIPARSGTGWPDSSAVAAPAACAPLPQRRRQRALRTIPPRAPSRPQSPLRCPCPRPHRPRAASARPVRRATAARPPGRSSA